MCNISHLDFFYIFGTSKTELLKRTKINSFQLLLAKEVKKQICQYILEIPVFFFKLTYSGFHLPFF